MADIKILDLTTATEITETTDYIPVVDTSDTTQDSTGTTKKATVRKLLGDRVLPDTIVGTTETQTLTDKTLSTGSVIDANVNVVEVLKKAYPIGSVYINASNSTNPATLLGFGTWEAFGQGRVMVGKASSGTFSTAGATGGAETHTLTVAQMPAHKHAIKSQSGNYPATDFTDTGFERSRTSNYELNNGTNIANEGGGQAHNNLQPYIVVYFWKRTA